MQPERLRSSKTERVFDWISGGAHARACATEKGVVRGGTAIKRLPHVWFIAIKEPIAADAYAQGSSARQLRLFQRWCHARTCATDEGNAREGIAAERLLHVW